MPIATGLCCNPINTDIVSNPMQYINFPDNAHKILKTNIILERRLFGYLIYFHLLLFIVPELTAT